jgi:hypothetical protein
MASHIPEYREVNWTCQAEEVVEDKVAAKVEAAGARVARARAAGAKAAGVWDPGAARGREPRIYAAARLVGPASRMNAAFPVFR